MSFTERSTDLSYSSYRDRSESSEGSARLASGAVISVSQAVQRLKGAVAPVVSGLWVQGEVGTYTKAASGHQYFMLKDGQAAIRCVLFAGTARLMRGVLRSGLKVEIYGEADIYPDRGELQIRVMRWRSAGLGILYESFLALRAKLQAEGLFARERKKALPFFVRRIGIVTSLKAAALQDVLRTLSRRAPWVSIVVYPAQVQGEEAAQSLLQALVSAARRNETDVILLVRGGGSFEDLMPFNNEALVRQIAAMPLLVICGIGHETDLTLSELAADLRASTPTAAAELAVQSAQVWENRLSQAHNVLLRALRLSWEYRAQRLDRASLFLSSPAHIYKEPSRRVSEAHVYLKRANVRAMQDAGARIARAADELSQNMCRAFDSLERSLARAQSLVCSPASIFNTQRQRLSLLETRLLAQMRQTLQRSEKDLLFATALLANKKEWLFVSLERALEQKTMRLDALDPLAPLKRGYVLLEKEGLLLTKAADMTAGDSVRMRFADGNARAIVESVELTPPSHLSE